MYSQSRGIREPMQSSPLSCQRMINSAGIFYGSNYVGNSIRNLDGLSHDTTLHVSVIMRVYGIQLPRTGGRTRISQTGYCAERQSNDHVGCSRASLCGLTVRFEHERARNEEIRSYSSCREAVLMSAARLR